MLVDAELSRRFEVAEGRSGTRFVDSRARIAPDRGACWTEITGVLATYDGPSSPVTQTFGLGIAKEPTADDFDRLEAFFGERGAPVNHEVSPLAHPATLALLNERGYRPCEFTSILFQELGEEAGRAGGTRGAQP